MTARPEIAVAEGIEVASREVHLEVGTQDKQVNEVDSAGSAGGPSHCMINMHNHQAINALATLPHLLVGGGRTQGDFKDRVPHLLMLAAAIVHELPSSSITGLS